MAALTWNCSVQQRKTSYMLKLPGVSVKQSSEWMLPRQSSSKPPLRCWRRNPFSCWRLRSLQESWSSRIHAVWTQTTQPQWRMKVGFDPVKHVTPAQTAPVKRPRLHTDPQCFLTRANHSWLPVECKQTDTEHTGTHLRARNHSLSFLSAKDIPSCFLNADQLLGAVSQPGVFTEGMSPPQQQDAYESHLHPPVHPTAYIPPHGEYEARQSTCSFMEGNWCGTEIPPEGTRWVYLFSVDGEKSLNLNPEA